MKSLNELNQLYKSGNELLTKIKQHDGYLLCEDMEDILNLFGSDFEIVIKFWEHNRQKMSLYKYFKLRNDYEANEYSNDHLFADIKEVFICAGDYDVIFR